MASSSGGWLEAAGHHCADRVPITGDGRTSARGAPTPADGDVQFGLSSMDDVPYAIGPARQALEIQMGGGEDA